MNIFNGKILYYILLNIIILLNFQYWYSLEFVGVNFNENQGSVEWKMFYGLSLLIKVYLERIVNFFFFYLKQRQVYYILIVVRVIILVILV